MFAKKKSAGKVTPKRLMDGTSIQVHNFDKMRSFREKIDQQLKQEMKSPFQEHDQNLLPSTGSKHASKQKQEGIPSPNKLSFQREMIKHQKLGEGAENELISLEKKIDDLQIFKTKIVESELFKDSAPKDSIFSQKKMVNSEQVEEARLPQTVQTFQMNKAFKPQTTLVRSNEGKVQQEVIQQEATPEKLEQVDSNFPMKHNTPDKNDITTTNEIQSINKQYTYGSLNIGQIDFRSQNVEKIFHQTQNTQKDQSQQPTFSQLSLMNDGDTFGAIKTKYFQKNKDLNFQNYHVDTQKSLNLFSQYQKAPPNTLSQNSLFGNVENDNSANFSKQEVKENEKKDGQMEIEHQKKEIMPQERETIQEVDTEIKDDVKPESKQQKEEVASPNVSATKSVTTQYYSFVKEAKTIEKSPKEKPAHQSNEKQPTQQPNDVVMMQKILDFSNKQEKKETEPFVFEDNNQIFNEISQSINESQLERIKINMIQQEDTKQIHVQERKEELPKEEKIEVKKDSFPDKIQSQQMGDSKVKDIIMQAMSQISKDVSVIPDKPLVVKQEMPKVSMKENIVEPVKEDVIEKSEVEIVPESKVEIVEQVQIKPEIIQSLEDKSIQTKTPQKVAVVKEVKPEDEFEKVVDQLMKTNQGGELYEQLHKLLRQKFKIKSAKKKVTIEMETRPKEVIETPTNTPKDVQLQKNSEKSKKRKRASRKRKAQDLEHIEQGEESIAQRLRSRRRQRKKGRR